MILGGPFSRFAISGGPAFWRDRSSTITTGGAAQQLMAAAQNASRGGFWIQNQSSGDLWILEDDTGATAAASQPSMKLDAGQLYETPAQGVPQGVISIFGASTGQSFACREW